jgi:RNA polymerase sigma-70 factor (ECF subfamily)
MLKSSIPNSLEERESRLCELFGRAQAGDRESYQQLLEMMMEILTGYFRRSLGRGRNTETPEVGDLVQETLLAIHEKRATFDTREKFGPWMFAIARYKMIDYFRKSGREKVAADWEGLEATLVTEGDSESLATHEDLECLLGYLPPKQGELLRMLKLEGRSVKDVSKEVGMTETALKVTVHRAMKTLKLRLREEME